MEADGLYQRKPQVNTMMRFVVLIALVPIVLASSCIVAGTKCPKTVPPILDDVDINPFTPTFKKFLLPTFLGSEVVR